MFGNLFENNKHVYSSIKVDIHSHLIPGIDDGVKTVQESIDILRYFSKLGFSKVITTPHIMGDFYKNTPDIIKSGLEVVKEALKKEDFKIIIDAAAEYYLDEYFMKNLKSGKALMTLGDSYLLFELPYSNPPIQLNEAIFIMQSQSYKPILAHPERYLFYQGNIDKIKMLKEKGVLMQINLNSLLGYYSKPAKKLAENMIKENLVDFVGTDVHNMKHMESIDKCITGKWGTRLASMTLKNNSLL